MEEVSFFVIQKSLPSLIPSLKVPLISRRRSATPPTTTETHDGISPRDNERSIDIKKVGKGAQNTKYAKHKPVDPVQD